MKKAIYLLCSLMVALTACEDGGGKSAQTIEFAELAPQNLMDSSLQLQATASSDLPVTFFCSDSGIAVIRGNVAEFVAAGTAYIVAEQAGNESFYEAPNVTRKLTIRSWDSNKKNQAITFELPEAWSNENPALQLVAVATSGLPVKFTASDNKALITRDNQLILYHGPYTYDVYIDITASQEGDSTYNPAENVVRKIRAIGEGSH
ncbi:MAG: hypothetical protein LBO71_03265 [Prevotellaceae bacterium]|jgi:hypothetical protein|nr:hypothetical protein [Prevotellaceae bacterium]